MIQAPAVTMAYAFDLRPLDGSAVVGVGVTAPAFQHLSYLIEGAASVFSLTMATGAWSELQAWVAGTNARLPAQPAPMPSGLIAALFGPRADRGMGAARFAAFPIAARSAAEVAAIITGMLPGLLVRRRFAA
jgi:hypothetical protein